MSEDATRTSPVPEVAKKASPVPEAAKEASSVLKAAKEATPIPEAAKEASPVSETTKETSPVLKTDRETRLVPEITSGVPLVTETTTQAATDLVIAIRASPIQESTPRSAALSEITTQAAKFSEITVSVITAPRSVTVTRSLTPGPATVAKKQVSENDKVVIAPVTQAKTTSGLITESSPVGEVRHAPLQEFASGSIEPPPRPTGPGLPPWGAVGRSRVTPWRGYGQVCTWDNPCGSKLLPTGNDF